MYWNATLHNREELDEAIAELRDEEKDLENDLRQLDTDLKERFFG